MKALFDTTFTRVIGHEGGYQTLKNDRGNWTSGVVGKGTLKGTKFGIAAMSYPNLDIKNLTVAQAKEIYKRDWWDKMGMDRYPAALTFQMFDAAINHGMSNANKILQRAVGAKDDGIIGEKTLVAVNKTELNDLLMLFIACRIEFFTKIKTFSIYGPGWMNRMANNLKIATIDND